MKRAAGVLRIFLSAALLLLCGQITPLAIPALLGQGAGLSAIPRDQALYLLGAESSNPRDYDPATEHDSGDKLVYSGLVSLDPNLNLVPELAQSWEVAAEARRTSSPCVPTPAFRTAGRLRPRMWSTPGSALRILPPPRIRS